MTVGSEKEGLMQMNDKPLTSRPNWYLKSKQPISRGLNFWQRPSGSLHISTEAATSSSPQHVVLPARHLHQHLLWNTGDVQLDRLNSHSTSCSNNCLNSNQRFVRKMYNYDATNVIDERQSQHHDDHPSLRHQRSLSLFWELHQLTDIVSVILLERYNKVRDAPPLPRSFSIILASVHVASAAVNNVPNRQIDLPMT